MRVRAGRSLISTAGNGDSTYDFNAHFEEVVARTRCKSALRYQFIHNEREDDESIDKYVNAQLRSIGEKLGDKLREGHVKIEGNLLYAIKNHQA